MKDKGMAFIVLSVVFLTAIIGLVMFFSNGNTTGRIADEVIETKTCDAPSTPVLVLPAEKLQVIDSDWVNTAGYFCDEMFGVDEYGYETWCCTPPQGIPIEGIVPVEKSLKTPVLPE